MWEVNRKVNNLDRICMLFYFFLRLCSQFIDTLTLFLSHSYCNIITIESKHPLSFLS